MATEFKRMRQLTATDSEWAIEDPILLKGEIAFSTDLNRYKVGDGVAIWSSLPYWNTPDAPDDGFLYGRNTGDWDTAIGYGGLYTGNLDSVPYMPFPMFYALDGNSNAWGGGAKLGDYLIHMAQDTLNSVQTAYSWTSSVDEAAAVVYTRLNRNGVWTEWSTNRVFREATYNDDLFLLASGSASYLLDVYIGNSVINGWPTASFGDMVQISNISSSVASMVGFDAGAKEIWMIRKNSGTWEAEWTNLTGLKDAPSDGNTYVRKDGAWVIISQGISDALSNGVLYGRKDGVWARAVLDGGQYYNLSLDDIPDTPNPAFYKLQGNTSSSVWDNGGKNGDHLLHLSNGGKAIQMGYSYYAGSDSAAAVLQMRVRKADGWSDWTAAQNFIQDMYAGDVEALANSTGSFRLDIMVGPDTTNAWPGATTGDYITITNRTGNAAMMVGYSLADNKIWFRSKVGGVWGIWSEQNIGGSGAPEDGTMYGRIDGGWGRAVAVAGDVMNGPLFLSQTGNPSITFLRQDPGSEWFGRWFMGSGGMYLSCGIDGNATVNSMRFLIDQDTTTGNYGSSSTSFTLNNTQTASINYTTEDDLPNGSTIVTRIRGDARYAAISSIRYKENVQPYDISGIIEQFNIKQWIWGGEIADTDERAGTMGFGLIAEEVNEFLPQAVVWQELDDGTRRINGLDPLTLISVLIDELTDVKTQLAGLRSKVG